MVKKKGVAEARTENNSQPSIMSHFKLNFLKVRDRQIANNIIRSFDKQYLQRLLLEFIVTSNLPFSFIDNKGLRKILKYLNPSVRIERVISSSKTLRHTVYSHFSKHQQHTITLFRESPGKIYFSFDGWTSSNHHAFYGIMCFFRIKENKLCKLLLGVPELAEHFGTSIAGEILAVLHAFRVTQEKTGYFTLENAENNTTAMVAIGEKLGFDGKLRRGRCIGHIINLAAKALLFGNNPDGFEAQLDGTSPLNPADYQFWRTQGPVGKLHNLVVDVRNILRISESLIKGWYCHIFAINY
jgi:hypothetical protein